MSETNQIHIFAMEKEDEFPTQSNINRKKLSGDNKIVWLLLQKHLVIDKYMARNKGVDELRSRISDLKNVHGKTIYSKLTATKNGIKYKIYSLSPFE